MRIGGKRFYPYRTSMGELWIDVANISGLTYVCVLIDRNKVLSCSIGALSGGRWLGGRVDVDRWSRGRWQAQIFDVVKAPPVPIEQAHLVGAYAFDEKGSEMDRQAARGAVIVQLDDVRQKRCRGPASPDSGGRPDTGPPD